MGIHYGQVLHKEPEKLFRFKLKTNSSRYIQGTRPISEY